MKHQTPRDFSYIGPNLSIYYMRLYLGVAREKLYKSTQIQLPPLLKRIDSIVKHYQINLIDYLPYSYTKTHEKLNHHLRR